MSKRVLYLLIVLISLTTITLYCLSRKGYVYHVFWHNYNSLPVNNSTCILTGHIDGYKMNGIGLTYMSDTGIVHYSFDHHDGDFVYKIKLKEPVLATLSYHQYNWLPKLGKHAYKTIFLEPGKVIYVEGTADSLQNLVVMGSPLQTQMDSLDKAIPIQMKYDVAALDSEIKIEHKEERALICAIKDSATHQAKWQDFYTKYFPRISTIDYYLKFIKSHPSSPLSAAKLYTLNMILSPAECKAVYDSLDSNIKELSYAKKFLKVVEAKENTQIGLQAADISIPNVEGKPVPLSSLRGKVVLLEFWASSCGPCRATNSELIEVYNEFHKKGFEIYAVSGDHNKKDWTNAIEKDGLKWINVSELNGTRTAENKYGITYIPSNILIDKTGKIIARCLHKKDLEDKLATLLP